MARCDSVTVSMAAETMGTFNAISRVRQARVSASDGNTSLRAGLEQNIVESEALVEYVLDHRDFYHDSVEWACGRDRPFATEWNMRRRCWS